MMQCLMGWGGVARRFDAVMLLPPFSEVRVWIVRSVDMRSDFLWGLLVWV